MFDNPDMPDLDSMSQDELIVWLEQQAQQQREKAAESSPDKATDSKAQAAQRLPDAAAEAWRAGLAGDESLRPARSPGAKYAFHSEQQLDDEDDDETPTALPVISESGSDDTTDPLTWLEDRTTEAESRKIAAGAERVDRGDSPGQLEDLGSATELEDPLKWLDSLANEVSAAAQAFAPGGDLGAPEDNSDDAYEDDAIDEDESLYSQRVGEPAPFPEALIGLDEPLVDEFSTQSMAPLPDFLVPAADAPASDREPLVESARADSIPPSAPETYDSLTHAFLMQDQQAELEAWYAERLRAVAAAGDTASQPAGAPAPGAEALKPPPPGLAAGFNTARGKIAAGKLEEALGDYETLLRANIGLDLVVSDMQWLIKQAQHQDNPAVHCVLGDALMRQGQLQQALDVYRHALKLL